MHGVNEHAPLSVTLLLSVDNGLLSLLADGVLLEGEHIPSAANVLTESATPLLDAVVTVVYSVRLERRPF